MVGLHERRTVLVPFKRIETFFRDLMDVPISSATIDQARKTIYQNLELWEQALIKKLINEDVLGADESGLRVNQDLLLVARSFNRVADTLRRA